MKGCLKAILSTMRLNSAYKNNTFVVRGERAGKGLIFNCFVTESCHEYEEKTFKMEVMS